MTIDILQIIKLNESFRDLADSGQDSALAAAIQETLPQRQPITIANLRSAAPQTLAAIANGQNPLAELEVVASRVRADDPLGVLGWAETLAMLGKMPDAEFVAVSALAAAAAPVETISHTQVSAALSAVRSRDAEITQPRVDADGKPVLDGDGNQIVDVIQHAGTVRATSIDWSKV